MKKRNFHKKMIAMVAAGVLLLGLLGGIFAPLLVQAASPATRSVDITVDLNDDGSGAVTEVWDVTIEDGTEYYLTKYDLLDGQDITGLSVSDETGREYTNIGTWSSERSGADKYGECGLISTKGGYEICWGIFGDYGSHTYTVRYTMPGLVQSYGDTPAINQTFIANNLSVAPQKVSLTIRKEGLAFTQATTGVWGFGTTGDIHVNNGQVELQTSKKMAKKEYVAVLVQFEPGMFHPAVNRGQSFEEAKENALQGSDYTPGPEDGQGGGLVSGKKTGTNGSSDYSANGDSGRYFINILFNFFSRAFMPIIALCFVFWGLIRRGRQGRLPKKTLPANYKDVPYSRELPWGNSLTATYTRLKDLGQLSNEGTIIGAYLLRWVRTRQVDIVKEMGGLLGNKEQEAIKLYQPREMMQPLERSLYNMLTEAAGADYILQPKEFERWSKAHYSRIEGWLTSYENAGKAQMRQLGALAEQDTATFFGLIHYKKQVFTPTGETYTANMFGFKKYLNDFTIVNEREAREVQLWDDYLVYAQVFGIADTVAEQFKQLYPDYFLQMATETGTSLSAFDVLMMTRMVNSFSHAAYTGYRAGYNAAHTTSYSGGGGGFSGGGGFGGGGFGGGGGGGGTR